MTYILFCIFNIFLSHTQANELLDKITRGINQLNSEAVISMTACSDEKVYETYTYECDSIRAAIQILDLAYDNSQLRTFARASQFIANTEYRLKHEESTVCHRTNAAAYTRLDVVNAATNFNPKLQHGIRNFQAMVFGERKHNVSICTAGRRGGLEHTMIHEAGHSHGFGECQSDALVIASLAAANLEYAHYSGYECQFGNGNPDRMIHRAHQLLEGLD
jgi:hypothetical protein